jgi:hypothetical protein
LHGEFLLSVVDGAVHWRITTGEKLPVANVVDGIFRVGNGGAQLCLAHPVAIDDSRAEFTRLRINVVEELRAPRGLGELMGGKKSDADTDNQKQDLLHDSAPQGSGVGASFKLSWARAGSSAQTFAGADAKKGRG